MIELQLERHLFRCVLNYRRNGINRNYYSTVETMNVYHLEDGWKFLISLN